MSRLNEMQSALLESNGAYLAHPKRSDLAKFVYEFRDIDAKLTLAAKVGREQIATIESQRYQLEQAAIYLRAYLDGLRPDVDVEAWLLGLSEFGIKVEGVDDGAR